MEKFLRINNPSFNRKKLMIILLSSLILISSATIFYRSYILNSCYFSFKIAMISPFYNIHTVEKWDRVMDLCESKVFGENFTHRDLYANFKLLSHISENYARKGFRTKDKYHDYLYYANIHGDGRYSKELSSFEASMTRWEKAKSYGVLSSLLVREEEKKYFKEYDYATAFEYLKKAAELGIASYQVNFGLVLVSGDFYDNLKIKTDLINGYKWIYLSNYLGYSKVSEDRVSIPDILKGISNFMQNSNIIDGEKKAIKLADQWLAENSEWIEEAKEIAKQDMKEEEKYKKKQITN